MANEEKKDAKKGLKALTAKKEAKKAPEKKAPEKKEKAAKSERRGPIRYIRDVAQEVKRVKWPTKKELFKGVLAVIVFVVAFTLIIWLMDLALTPALKWLIG